MLGSVDPVPLPGEPAIQEMLYGKRCEEACVHYLERIENYADYIDELASR